MPIVSKDTLKSYFRDGHVPLERMYIDLIDSMMMGDLYNPGIFMNLPAARFYWPLTAGYTSGELSTTPDFIHQWNLQLIPNNDPPRINAWEDTPPCMGFNGSQRAYSNDTSTHPSRLDISGEDIIITADIYGLTIGAWVFPEYFNGEATIVGKWKTTDDNRSYLLSHDSGDGGDFFKFQVCEDGTDDTVDTIISQYIPESEWYFVVARYHPNHVPLMDHGYLTIKVNNLPLLTTFAASETIYDSNADFELGKNLVGSMRDVFVCAGCFPTFYTDRIFQQTKILFGV